MRTTFVTLSAVLCAAPLMAASQIEENWNTYGGNGFFNWQASETVAYDAGRSRRDTEQSRLFSSQPEKRVEIERVDLDKRWELDPKRQHYTEESISEAQARLQKQMEKDKADWDKKHKGEKPTEDPYRIKSARTSVDGPGAAVAINGFNARPYTIKTVIEYESAKDQTFVGRQTLYDKEWVADSSALAQYQKEELAFWQSRGQAQMGNAKIKELQEAMKNELAKAHQDSTQNPWLLHYDAIGKIKGQPVRSIMGFTFFIPGQTQMPPKESASQPQDSGLVQPGDLSGGVGGLVSGIASRWASHKVEEKVQAKMAEHPVWVDEVSKDLDNAGIGWGFMTEVKNVRTGVSADVFNLPANYKKVKSL